MCYTRVTPVYLILSLYFFHSRVTCERIACGWEGEGVAVIIWCGILERLTVGDENPIFHQFVHKIHYSVLYLWIRLVFFLILHKNVEKCINKVVLNNLIVHCLHLYFIAVLSGNENFNHIVSCKFKYFIVTYIHVLNSYILLSNSNNNFTGFSFVLKNLLIIGFFYLETCKIYTSWSVAVFCLFSHQIYRPFCCTMALRKVVNIGYFWVIFRSMF